MATKPNKISSKYEDIISKSIVISSGSPVVYQMTPETEINGTLRRITIGKKHPLKTNKTVLLVGETGTGKSTMINALVNYAMGVKWEDKVWFKIVQDEKRSQVHSQTSDVTVYEIFGFEGEALDFSLTIIDTPGYGDTRGKAHDAVVRQKLFDLFRSDDGVQEINAVGLVLKATENRVHDRLIRIFDSVVSLFGKDIEENIVALMTHSDGMPPKNALQAILAANMKCAKNEKKQPVHFLFNNCQREERNEDTEVPLENALRQTMRGMQRFSQFLGEAQPKKLKATVEVMKLRIQLTASIHNLQERIKSIEKSQVVIKNTQKELKKHQSELENDANFTIDTEEEYRELQHYGGGWSFSWLTVCKFDGVTRCTDCRENCHYPGCTIAWDASLCEVMSDGCCTVCSGRCSVSKHVKDDSRYVSKSRTVKKTLQDIKEKYEAKVGDLSSLLRVLQKRKEEAEAEKTRCLEQAYQNVIKLDQIALSVQTMSTQAYLGVLIEKMKEKGDTEKVRKLENIASKMDEGTKNLLSGVFDNQ
ncbi:uncharacterized protein LOC118336632 [Morone saxatilis]|uniref:uncharacterized protein LOC118336632 n=1 Tax=Morone saxatilis TaxID=34816 RepID=UPI0015E1E753|nr:uncharacterized protein LOC118336632 [Morone saxatilis]